MAEGIARKCFAARQSRDAANSEPIIVSSAGLMSGGVGAVSDAVTACSSMGVDISAHVSRKVTPEILSEADLVLCMERMHVREVAVMSREVLSRAFTVREFARRATETPRREGESVRKWAARLSAERPLTALMSAGAGAREDDIADPMGHKYEIFARTAWEISEHVQIVCKLLTA